MTIKVIKTTTSYLQRELFSQTDNRLKKLKVESALALRLIIRLNQDLTLRSVDKKYSRAKFQWVKGLSYSSSPGFACIIYWQNEDTQIQIRNKNNKLLLSIFYACEEYFFLLSASRLFITSTQGPCYLRTGRKKRRAWGSEAWGFGLAVPNPYPVNFSILGWCPVLSRFCPRVPYNYRLKIRENRWMWTVLLKVSK